MARTPSVSPPSTPRPSRLQLSLDSPSDSPSTLYRLSRLSSPATPPPDSRASSVAPPSPPGTSRSEDSPTPESSPRATPQPYYRATTPNDTTYREMAPSPSPAPSKFRPPVLPTPKQTPFSSEKHGPLDYDDEGADPKLTNHSLKPLFKLSAKSRRPVTPPRKLPDHRDESPVSDATGSTPRAKPTSPLGLLPPFEQAVSPSRFQLQFTPGGTKRKYPPEPSSPSAKKLESLPSPAKKQAILQPITEIRTRGTRKPGVSGPGAVRAQRTRRTKSLAM